MLIGWMLSFFARYAPLVLPQALYAFPDGDYMKYLPRFNGEGDVIVEEHLACFYSFAENFNVKPRFLDETICTEFGWVGKEVV
jgi:hypothetical protein